jgi:hypothetical protein
MDHRKLCCSRLAQRTRVCNGETRASGTKEVDENPMATLHGTLPRGNCNFLGWVARPRKCTPYSVFAQLGSMGVVFRSLLPKDEKGCWRCIQAQSVQLVTRALAGHKRTGKLEGTHGEEGVEPGPQKPTRCPADSE